MNSTAGYPRPSAVLMAVELAPGPSRPHEPASTGSWPASVRPRARRRQSVNASASAPRPAPPFRHCPWSPLVAQLIVGCRPNNPRRRAQRKHRRWRTRLPREPSTDAGHDSADARIPGRDGTPVAVAPPRRFGVSRRSSMPSSGGGKACPVRAVARRKPWYKVRLEYLAERPGGISHPRGDAMSMKRREFLAAGLALNIGSTAIALAQQGGATPDRAGARR